MERHRDGRAKPTRYVSPPTPGRARQRAFCIGASPTGDDMSELKELLRTAGVAVVGELVQHREKPHPNLYLGSGKVDELKPLLKAADANLVAVDDELTPRQERNLEEALGMPVIDRTAVILDIFAGHAHTADGKLQVELAQLEYNMARMRGLWTHLERLGAGRGVGGIGTRGPGESQIETDRRLARDRISALRRRLDHVKSTRAVMRAERERAHLPNVALAGYTNAGKSTLLNALTGAHVGVGDRLFHTLDPTTRTLRLHGRTYLVTDTVGFIRKLPHQLVNAFAATLEETKLADLVLHVVDAHETEEELEAMTRAVDDVLEEIGVGDTPRLLVLNKADLLDEERRRELSFRHPEGLPRLRRHRRGPRGARRGDRGRLRALAAGRRPAGAVLRGPDALRAPRRRRRPRARGHRRRRARHRPPARRRGRALRPLRQRRTARELSGPEDPKPSAPRSSADGGSVSTTRVAGARNGDEQQLRDAVAGLALVALLAEVDQHHADLAAVGRVDQAGAVDDGEPVARREPGARDDEPGDALGQRHRDAGRHHRAARPARARTPRRSAGRSPRRPGGCGPGAARRGGGARTVAASAATVTAHRR